MISFFLPEATKCRATKRISEKFIFSVTFFSPHYTTITHFTAQIKIKILPEVLPTCSPVRFYTEYFYRRDFALQIGRNRLSLRRNYVVRSTASSPALLSAVYNIKISE